MDRNNERRIKQIRQANLSSNLSENDKQQLRENAKQIMERNGGHLEEMNDGDLFRLRKINELLNGKVERRSLSNKQKAIFLDRDGTINTYVGFLRDIDKFELTDTAAQAIRMINDSEYLAIVVTNQPVIARGEVSFEQLDEIHQKMETLLGKEGAFIDGLYFCPHHPDSGFEGEVKELKIDCDCRKPKPGMLLKAAKDFNIDLSQSFMIGDSDNDMAAGSAAGCKCIRIDRDGDLLKAVKQALNKEI